MGSSEQCRQLDDLRLYLDARLRHAEFAPDEGVRYLGTSIASLSELQRVLVVGSNLRKDHPLFAQRIRQAVRKGCAVSSLQDRSMDWAMPVAHTLLADASIWVQALAGVAAAVAAQKGVEAPVPGTVSDETRAIASSLLGGERKAILLGNAAAHHGKASSLLAGRRSVISVRRPIPSALKWRASIRVKADLMPGKCWRAV